MIRQTLLPLALAISLFGPACGKPDSTPAAPEAPTIDKAEATRKLQEMERQAVPPKAAAVMAARQGAATLGSTLKKRVKETMGQGGPVAALEVCSTEAQALTAKIGEARGVLVGRSSQKLRNPANAGPQWVRTWIADFHARPSAEQTIKSDSEIVAIEGGELARFIKPIKLEAPCLACHGPKESLAPEVVALLAERYPEDKATGYAEGDIRGVIWAEAPVKPVAEAGAGASEQAAVPSEGEGGSTQPGQ